MTSRQLLPTLLIVNVFVSIVAGKRCNSINSIGTSVRNGYIQDTETGVNFFLAIPPDMRTISLSWLVLPNPESLVSDFMQFWLYKNGENVSFSNFNTTEVNGSHIIDIRWVEIMNIQLKLKRESAISPVYCCAKINCIVFPPPPLSLLDETRTPDAFQFTVTFKGSDTPIFIGVCMMKYWETSKTDPTLSVNIIECPRFSTDCTMDRLPPYTQFQASMGCKYSSEVNPARIQWSQPIAFRTSEIAPGSVQDVQYFNIGSGITRSVVAKWDPVDIDQQRGLILFYMVTLTGLAPPCIEHREVHNTSQLNYTFSGLDYACNYSVVVTAWNGAGEGEAQRRILEEYREKPSRPTLLSSSVTARRVTLVWYPPERPYGLVTYRLFLKVGDTPLKITEQLQISPNHGEYSYSFEDLKPHTSYTFTLRAENHARHCDIDLTVTTRQSAPTASPTTLTALGRPGHPTVLEVTWTPVPNNESNGDISFYTLSWWLTEGSDVECHDDSTANVSKFHHNITDSGILSYDITGLSSNSTYCLAITASTDEGEGPSAIASAKTVKEFIQVQETVKKVTEVSVHLGWRFSTPVDISEVSTHLLVDGVVVNSTNKSSHFLKNLKPYTLYNISIIACWIEYLENGCGPAKYVAIETKATKPSAPLKLSLNYLEQNKVTLSWEGPAFSNGPISHYRVVYYETTSGDDSKVELNTTKRNISGIEIQCNKLSVKEYAFEVSAVVYNASEFEGPPARITDTFCSSRNAIGIIITVVVVPCGIVIICVLLVWSFFLYPQKKIDIKLSNAIYHPEMVSSTGKGPEKEVFDTLKTNQNVMEGIRSDYMHMPVLQDTRFCNLSSYIDEVTVKPLSH